MEDTDNQYVHIVGNGTSTKRSNAHTLDWNGNAWFAGNITTGINKDKLVTEKVVDTKIANMVDSAPETLDTLNELAAALGNDPNFATTVATEIGKKANSADLATVAKTGNYSDLINKRTVNGSTNNIETNFINVHFILTSF